MFSYFSHSYPWNLALLSALDLGANLSDVDVACREFRDRKFGDEAQAAEAWTNAWSELGNRALRQADLAEASECSAAERRLRASVYFLMAERGVAPGSSEKLEIYNRGIDAFQAGISVTDPRTKPVTVPYRESELPGLLTLPHGEGPFPCMIHFQGLDWIKEFYYLQMADAFAKRGVACLFVDQPGTGGALRLNGLAADTETEHAAAACLDFLEQQPSIDPQRVGIQAISLGGYYAPRAAAYEKRIACAIAWGAIWNYMELLQLRMAQGAGYADSVPHMQEHIGWVFGVESLAEIIPIFQKIDLEPIAPLVECPLLIVHGKNDAQVPVDQATRSFEAAVNSAERKLVILDEETGGVQHCNLDNLSIAREIMADWAARVLKARKP